MNKKDLGLLILILAVGFVVSSDVLKSPVSC